MSKFTLDDMAKFATEAWGPFGGAVVEKWVEFNQRFFGGKLRPVPLVLTNTLPHGRLLAFCSYSHAGHGTHDHLERAAVRAGPGRGQQHPLARDGAPVLVRAGRRPQARGRAVAARDHAT